MVITNQKKHDYKKYVIDSNLQYFKPHATKIEKTFSQEISSSLNCSSKFVNPKFFYDKKGSKLFEKICSLPEYYPTRTEISILENLKKNLPPFINDKFRIVELGSGSSVKIRLILDIFEKLQENLEYFPIDVSEILTESSEELLRDYSNLQITGIIDTYDGGLQFLKDYDDTKNLILFLGSSFGNFSPNDGFEFLKKIYTTMKPNDLFLIGLDMVKDKSILESAYDDSQGITAEFNLNVLSRINDELDGDFNLKNFKHSISYNEKYNRIEMYLKSLVNQSVILSKPNLVLTLEKNELIHTEYSHKYQIPQMTDLFTQTGFEIKQMWFDEKKYFSLTLLSKN